MVEESPLSHRQICVRCEFNVWGNTQEWRYLRDLEPHAASAYLKCGTGITTFTMNAGDYGTYIFIDNAHESEKKEPKRPLKLYRCM